MPTLIRLTRDTAHHLVDADVFDGPVHSDQLARFVDDPGHALVFALWQGAVVGFASGAVLLHPDKRPTFFVNEVGVRPSMQRRGIATQMCTRLFEIARDLGCHGVWLATEADNVAARALYRTLRARETTGVVVYDWDGAMDD